MRKKDSIKSKLTKNTMAKATQNTIQIYLNEKQIESLNTEEKIRNYGTGNVLIFLNARIFKMHQCGKRVDYIFFKKTTMLIKLLVATLPEDFSQSCHIIKIP